jgi:hypothetical protein
MSTTQPPAAKGPKTKAKPKDDETLKNVVEAINASREFKDLANDEDDTAALGQLLNDVVRAINPLASLRKAVDFKGQLCGVVLVMSSADANEII